MNYGRLVYRGISGSIPTIHQKTMSTKEHLQLQYNQGGLWEAWVHEMKWSHNKIIGGLRFHSDDLVTVLMDVESIRNLRPVTPFEALQEDGSVALTPGLFLIGRPLLSICTEIPDSKYSWI